ncbi:hypothetical protein DFJ73DRAFT_844423 [Zopfochytrium polystomum]|nr:hypothetical protein DFJ73DRAFT_844423 [Zopfochytrium polystomum]
MRRRSLYGRRRWRRVGHSFSRRGGGGRGGRRARRVLHCAGTHLWRLGDGWQWHDVRRARRRSLVLLGVLLIIVLVRVRRVLDGHHPTSLVVGHNVHLLRSVPIWVCVDGAGVREARQTGRRRASRKQEATSGMGKLLLLLLLLVIASARSARRADGTEA